MTHQRRDANARKTNISQTIAMGALLTKRSEDRGPAAEAGGQGRRSPSKAAPEGRAVSESDAESNDNSEDDDEDDPAGFATEPESEDDGGAQGGVRGPQRQRGSSLKLAAQFESKIGSLKRRSVRVSSWPGRGRLHLCEQSATTLPIRCAAARTPPWTETASPGLANCSSGPCAR